MSIANLKLDESAKLEFDVLITGADGSPSARFVIEGKDFAISYPCTQVNEGIQVDVGGLKNILPAGEYPVRLEIVLENKIYTPMQDTIVLEPVVEINTKTKQSPSIKESVKVIGKVSVTKAQTVDESAQKKIHAAMNIAEMLEFTPSVSMDASEIINQSMSSVSSIEKTELIELYKLLAVAESLEITYDEKLIPQLLEAEEKKVEVKDTSDYKLSASGKKVKAHKVVFNKGEEEHVYEEKLEEKLSTSDPIEKWISDFVHSTDKRFAGKSKDERIEMAKGAYYGAQRKEELELDEYMIQESGMTESELMSLGEKYMGFLALSSALKAKGAKNPEALAAWIGRKKHGKKEFQKAAASGKKMNESNLAKNLVNRLLDK